MGIRFVINVGGIATVNACKIVEKEKELRKNVRTSLDEVDFKNGEFVVAKSNKKTIGEVAFALYLPGSRDSDFKSPLPEGETWTKRNRIFDQQFSFQLVLI